VVIHRLLHFACCFLHTNIAITRQLIGTARTLEAECWQVGGETWVRGQKKMSHVLGSFGLLDLTMLRPVLVWRAFWNLRNVYFSNFPHFFSSRCQPRITEKADTESADTGVRLQYNSNTNKVHTSEIVFIYNNFLNVSASHAAVFRDIIQRIKRFKDDTKC